MSRPMSEKHSNAGGSAQKGSILKWKWKWFTPDQAAYRTQGDAGSLFSPGADSGTPWGAGVSLGVTWTVPYKLLSTDQQRAVHFVNGSSKLNGQHFV